MSEKSSAVNRKLKQAIDARKTLEDACKYQIDTLANFSSKLSLLCKGVDTELDNKLASFRQALNKGVHFEYLSPLINENIELIKKQEALQLAQQRQLQFSILKAGKLLQKTRGLPDTTRRSLRHLLDHEIHDVLCVQDFTPILERLVAFYYQALNAKLNDQSINDCKANPELAKELLDLANDLVLEDEATAQVKLIKNTITENDDLNTLLDAAINIISVVVDNINKERESAQSFLASLNQTLEELHNSIMATTKHSKTMGDEFDTLNKRIKNKISSLNQKTQKATSISSLKELVDNELKSLSEDFIIKEKLERSDREKLISSFDEINKRITHLENKLTSYKKRLNEQRTKSLLDGLTKLPNRAAFDERYNHEMHLFNLQYFDVTLVVIDVDHFKSINDRFGHTAGDITLQVIAKALQKSIRKSDFIARYGGEEFVMLMTNTELDSAISPLEKLRSAIKNIPFKFKDKHIEITISLGATQLRKGDTPIKAFDRADEALYEAKNTGRDRLCVSK